MLYLWGAEADEDLNELDSDIAKCFVFYSLENVESNSFYAYRQLTEVAVKALSPGINDMGTARIAIEFLADLMSRYPQQEVYRCVNDSEGDLRIILNPLELHHLFEFCFDPIRIYARNDKMVLYTFLKVCKMMLEMHGENSAMLQEVKLFTDKIMDDLEAKAIPTGYRHAAALLQYLPETSAGGC
ncbi:MAG: DUF2254 family protein [Owenweeksia sp.]|nr:DUF2254 family protein [Owenweeksia sp.]